MFEQLDTFGNDINWTTSGILVDLKKHSWVGAKTPIEPLAPVRLRSSKRSYATRRFDLDDAAGLVISGHKPASGDLVLARIDRLGHHRKIESPDGRRRHLYSGDEVLLCYGARYASDQFEALVPDQLAPCHMVAAGGIAANCVNRHGSTKPATRITPIGLVANAAGRVLNLKHYALPTNKVSETTPYTITVVGTSMNAGKTTTIAGIVKGLSRSGLKVAVGKVTGTGAGGDRWAYVDAGAETVLDFTDFGYASTYKVPAEELTALLPAMVETLASNCPDAVILELADGLFFPETADLVESPIFAELVDDVVIAASDAMGADAGIRRLAAHAITPIALAGRMTSSPLAVRETQSLTDAPIVPLDDLMDGKWIPARLAEPVQITA